MALTAEDIRKIREERNKAALSAGDIRSIREGKDKAATEIEIRPYEGISKVKPEPIRQMDEKTGPDASLVNRPAASTAKKYQVKYTGDLEQELRAAAWKSFGEGKQGVSRDLSVRADGLQAIADFKPAMLNPGSVPDASEKPEEPVSYSKGRLKNMRIQPGFDHEPFMLSKNEEYQNTQYYKKRADDKARLEGVMNETDFQKYAQTGAGLSNPSPKDRGLTFGSWAPFGPEIQNPVEYTFQNPMPPTNNSGGYDIKYLSMTDQERAVYNYYLGKGEKDKASDYLKILNRELNLRMQGKMSEAVQDVSNKNKAAGILMGLGNSLLAPAGYLDTVKRSAQNAVTGEYEPVDPNAPGMSGVNMGNASVAGLTHDPKAFTGNFNGDGSAMGDFLVQTGFSTAQYLTQLSLFGPQAALAVMSSGAAGQAAHDAAERGAGAKEALTLGTVAGFAEYFTEKIGIERLLNMKNIPKSQVGQVVGSLLTEVNGEGLEEVVTDYVNTLSDLAIMGDRSEYSQFRDALIQQGMSREEAERQTAIEFFAHRPAVSFAGGALSGVAFGIGAEAMNSASSAAAGKRLRFDGDGVFALADGMKSADPEIQAEAERLAQKEFSGNPVSNWALGNLGRMLGDTDLAELGANNRLPKASARDDERYQQVRGDNGMGKPATAVKDADGNPVQVLGPGAEPGKVRVQYGDGVRNVPVRSLSFSDVDTGELYEAAAELGTFGSRIMLDEAEKAGGSDAGFRTGFEAYYNYGLWGKDIRSVKIDMPVNQAVAAFNAGRADAAESVNIKPTLSKTAGGGEKAGLLHNNLSKQVNRETRSALDSIGRSFGLSVELADMGEGTNGYYDPASRTMKLNLHSERPLLTIAKHELTHHLQETAPKEYKAYRDFVLGELDRVDSGHLDKLITAQVDAYYQQKGLAISRDLAMDEVVADASEMFLTDDGAIQRLAKENKPLAGKVLAAIRAVVGKIKQALTGIEPKSDAAKMLHENLDIFQQAEDLWVKALYETAETGKKNTPQTAEKVKYSLNPKFADEYDAWDKKSTGGYFIIGKTSDVLKNIGVKDYQIYWDKGKLKKILAEHSEITDSIIKQVPQLLEHPVIVMQSLTVANRIVLLGEVYTEGGVPVLTAMELKPTDKQGHILDFAKLTSAHGRTDQQVQYLLDNSDILYLDPDKKRTDSWLEARRLQLPVGLTNYDSIASVTYTDRNVKGEISFGDASGKTAMQLALEQAIETAGSNNSVSENARDDASGEKKPSVKYSLNPYSDNQKRNWADSKRITLYENGEQFAQFVKDSLSGKTTGKLYFGTIPQKLAADIENTSGLQVEGYNLAINAYEIKKILLNSHGNEGAEELRGQRRITFDDLLLIPDIISSPDRIELDNRLYENKPVLRFVKTVGARTVVVTYVTRKHHDLSIQTMYGGINKESLSTATDVQASVLTSKTTRGTASTPNITLSEENSKGDEKFSLSGTEHVEEKAGSDTSVFDYAQNHTNSVDTKENTDYHQDKKYSLNGGNEDGTVRGNQEEGESARMADRDRHISAEADDRRRNGSSLRRHVEESSARFLGTNRGARQGEGRQTAAGRAGAASQTEREFLREYTKPGYRLGILQNGSRYAYKTASMADLNENARAALEILDQFGVPYAASQNGVFINSKGYTFHSDQAVTLTSKSGHLLVVNGNLSVNGIKSAYHEIYHFMSETPSKIYNTFMNVLEENVKYNAAYEKFINRIMDAHISVNEGVEAVDQVTGRILEEFGAYFCGETIVQNINSEAWRFIKGFVKDHDAVYQSMIDMFTAFKDQQNNPETRRYSLSGTEHVEYNDLLKENEKLRDAVEALKGEMKLTQGVQISGKAVDGLAKNILKENSSRFGREELRDGLQRIFDYIANDLDGNFEEAYRQTVELSKAVLEQSESVDRTLWEDTKEIRDRIRSTAVLVAEDERGDFPDGFEVFRRQNFGRLRISKDGMPVDTLYTELARDFPGYFSENTVGAYEMLRGMADFSDAVRPRIENPFGENLDEQAAQLAGEIYDRYFDIPQVKTFADKKAAQMKELRARYQNNMRELRERGASEIAGLKEKMEGLKGRISEEQYRQRWAVALERQRQDQLRDRRISGEYRAKIAKVALDLSKRLLNPTDSKHIPEGLRGGIAKFLSSLDFVNDRTNQGKPTAVNEIWGSLQKEWSKILAGQADEEFSGVTIDPDLVPRLEELLKKDAPTRLSDLNREEMEELWKVVAAVKAAVTAEDRIVTAGKRMTRAQAARSMIGELSRRQNEKGAKVKFLSSSKDFFRYDMTDSTRFAEMFGPTMEAMVQRLRDGQDVVTEHWGEAIRYTEDLFKKTKVWEWGNHYAEPKEFPLSGGGHISLTPAQVMSLYLLNKREQARKHIYGGGIESGKTQAGMMEYEKGRAKAVTEADVKYICSSLNPEQVRIAEGLGRFLSHQAAEWGNEASLEKFGYRKFTEKDYSPIQADTDFTASSIKNVNEAFLSSLSMTKATDNKANNPIVVNDVFEVFGRHITQMAAYSAYLNRLDDFQGVWNWKASKEEGSQSVKESLTGAGGEGANAYIHNLLVDINGRVADTRSGAEKLMSKYKAAAIGANLRVVIQQPTAYVRALTVMDAKYLVQGLAGKVDAETMKEYAPIARWKDWGYFEPGNGKQLGELIMGQHKFGQAASNAFMYLPGKLDSLTWGRLWKACEYEILDTTDVEKGSEAFYEAVGIRFSEVIDKTQVVDSVFHRSQMMRSKNFGNQMLTAFMGEPIKAYNALMGEFRKLSGAQGVDAKRAAGKNVLRAVNAFVLTNVVNALASSLIDAFRDDDDEEGFGDKYAQALLGDYDPEKGLWKNIQMGLSANLAENLNPLTMIPGVRDVLTLLQGWDVKRMDMQGFADLMNVAEKWISFTGGNSRYTLSFLLKETAGAASKVTGIPIGNILREFSTLVNAGMMAGDAAGFSSTGMRYWFLKQTLDIKNSLNLSDFAALEMEARKNGNRELSRLIAKELEAAGWTEDDISKRQGNLAKKQLEGADIVSRYLEAADAGRATEQEKIQKEAEKMGFSLSELLAAAAQERSIRSKRVQQYIDTEIDGDREKREKLVEDAIQAGISKSDFLAAVKEKKENAADSLEGGSSGIVYTNKQLLSAVLNGDKQSERIIRDYLEGEKEDAGKDAHEVQEALISSVGKELKDAFWGSGKLDAPEVKTLRELFVKQKRMDDKFFNYSDWDVKKYLEDATMAKFVSTYKKAMGNEKEWMPYYNLLKKAFGLQHDFIVWKGMGGK